VKVKMSLNYPCSAVLGINLETYIELHQALTKGTEVAQKVPLLEEAYYKSSDLKQVWGLPYL
jgi:hypothetical protein